MSSTLLEEKKTSEPAHPVIQLISVKASKAGIASVSQALLESAKRNPNSFRTVTINSLEAILEGPHLFFTLFRSFFNTTYQVLMA
jgi:hypothetical protein